jgi:hypothetical protein
MSSSDTNIIDTKQSEKSNNRKGNDHPQCGNEHEKPFADERKQWRPPFFNVSQHFLN